MVHDATLKRIETPSRERFSVSVGVLFQFSACVLLLTGRGAEWSVFALLLGGALIAFGAGEKVFAGSPWRWASRAFALLLWVTAFAVSIPW